MNHFIRLSTLSALLAQLAQLALLAASTVPLHAAAQTPAPAPTIPTEISLSPEAQALEAEFLALWPTLLRGDYKQGLPALESLLQRCQAQLGTSAPTTLKVQYFLGSTLHRLGRIAQAKATFEETLKQHQQAGSHDSRSALGSRAALARAVEDLESARAALPLYEQAMAQRSRTVGADDLESVTLVDDYAGALVEAGDVHAALPLLDQALQMRSQRLGPAHRWTLTTLNNRANAFTRVGRYAESLADNETVFQHRLKALGERDPTTLVAMSNTGVALANVGRADEALVLHQRAVALRAEILGPDHRSTLTTRRAVADDLLDLHRVGEARLALQQLADHGKSAWGPAHRHTLSARTSLARSLELLADYPAALAELNDLEALHVQAHGEDHFDTLSVAIQRARVLRLAGRADEGRQALERLLPMALVRYGTRMPIYADGVAELAACLLETGAPDRAVASLLGLLGDAAAAGNTAGDKAGDAAGAQRSAGLAQQARTAQWQRLLTRALAQQGRVKEAFAVLESQKSARLLASLGARAAADAAGLSRLDIGRLQDHEERVLLLRDAVRSARLPHDRQRAIEHLDQAVLAQQALQASLRLRHPLYGKLTRLPAAAQADAGRLPPGSVLVSFVVEDGQRVAAFTLDGRGRLQWHTLGQSPGLAQSVDSLRLWATQWGQRRLADEQGRVVEIVRWRTGGQPQWRTVMLDAPTCLNPAERPDCRPAAAQPVASRAAYDALRHHVAALLLTPLQARLQPYTHWVVAPDTGLGALPLDILPWRGGLVAEQVRISHVPSLAALNAVGRRQQARSGPGIALLAIGSPDFKPQPAAASSGAAAGPAAWAPLPAAETEIRSAAAQFAGRRTLVASGPAATEVRLRSLSNQGHLARARYVLMATHAWYEPSRPGRSHLAFGAVGSLPHEDGPMTATELAGLHMRSELTVVSACNTARGEAASADGQFGFAYGLNVAGNKNALLTLWPVGDQSAAAFVGRFFHHLARNGARGHADALYATKREFMQHPRPAWRHPRVWAAFALFGV